MTGRSLCAALLALASCQCFDPRTKNGTALFVVVRFDRLGATRVDQLRLKLPQLAKSQLAPEQAGPALDDPQTLRVLVDEQHARLTVSVDATWHGAVVAHGQTDTPVTPGRETQVTVVLEVPQVAPCGPDNCAGCCSSSGCLAGDDPAACGKGGGACAACAAGEACLGGQCPGCAMSCTGGGCCLGSTCITATSTGQCRSSTLSCAPCPAGRADACLGDGCHCGASPACEKGQRCFMGQCVCDAQSCGDGCCDGARRCVTLDRDHCTVPGDVSGAKACVACSATGADSCSPTGGCSCGAGPACPAGERCNNGHCECDATCTGCCQGSTCVTAAAQTASQCGLGRGACMACELDHADGCLADGGGCSCGDLPACAPGQHCVGGDCTCDGQSCPNGCCSNGRCVSPATTSQCGTGGAACGDCGQGATCSGGKCSSCSCTPTAPTQCCLGAVCAVGVTIDSCSPLDGGPCFQCSSLTANTCASGRCQCGTEAECPSGQRCSNGTCICDATSCPSGCCVSNRCVTQPAQSTSACGSGGGACASCGLPSSDRCSGGACQCGSGAACGAGQVCDAGTCTCDSSHCPGCCSGSTCITASSSGTMTCGADGSACVACNSSRANGCLNGTCACGTGPACSPGAQCILGSCVCGPTTCPGCCRGTVCENGTTGSSCGVAGLACDDCTAKGTGWVCSPLHVCTLCVGTTCP